VSDDNEEQKDDKDGGGDVQGESHNDIFGNALFC
jgi:hypothetical protein